jgi:hypothetical protein
LGHIVKRVKEASRRVQALANAADSSLSQSDRASAQMLADLYDETLSSMLAQLAELSSMAGSELNYVRMVSHLFDPITWRRQYTNPAIKGQAETLGAKPAVKAGIREYNARYGLAPAIEGHYVPVNEATARKIAAAYEALPVTAQ